MGTFDSTSFVDQRSRAIWRSDRSSAQVTAPVRPQILREQTCMIKEKKDGLQHWDTRSQRNCD